MRFLLMMIGMLMIVASCTSSRKENTNNDETSEFQEKWRPQIHFTPEQNWMNDPNGMVYYNGEYHLFYQHNPDTTVWGPMHWGHAVSKDLIHWEHLPIALYPDSLGTIFSGSAFVDLNNTTNFAEDDNPPLVAVYTNHSHEKESEGRNDFQSQSIAYSLNNGREWEKYKNNPVLPNPGIRDFRDPKITWYEPEEKWIMALAVKDRVSFYSSSNLKDWNYESDFGKGVDHGGVVECPDLFPLETENGEKKWVLLVSVNPGGPNGGSGTKYFIGDFNGSKFKSDWPAEKEVWVDHGKDNYAGVTWSNEPNNEISRTYLGWMSNWQYANVVPTEAWRSAMTLPRELTLWTNENGQKRLKASLVGNLDKIAGEWQSIDSNISASGGSKKLPFDLDEVSACHFTLKLETPENSVSNIELSNPEGNKAIITLDRRENKITFDRRKSGKTDFSENFPGVFPASWDFKNTTTLDIIVDQSSIELFVDDGRLQMTHLVFPKSILSQIKIAETDNASILSARARELKSIWK